MKTINTIYDKGLCIGCGLCGSLNEGKVSFEFDKNGFYKPKALEDIDIERYCPGVTVEGNFSAKNDIEKVWGPVCEANTGFSLNDTIRHRGSSGGGITGFVLYLLETNYVSGVIHIGSDLNDPLLNKAGVSRSLSELTEKCGSRYAPVLTLVEIKQILDSSLDTFAFIGKPCDIAGISNFLNVYPEYRSRIKVKVSFFCAGTPSINATKKTIKHLGLNEPLRSLRYRGDGWPGFFTAIDDSGKEGKITYNDSWGKILGRDIHLRCKLCPDGIGMLSDITFADGWEEEGGYPSFEERPGESLIIARNELAKKLLYKAVEKGFLNIKSYDMNLLKNIQKFQYKRRLNIGARLLSYFLITGFMPKFKNLFVYSNLIKSSPAEVASNFLGFIKRIRTHRQSSI